MKPRAQKLLRWVLFSVMIAVAPIGITFLNELTDGQAPSWPTAARSVLSRGELLLISAAVAAGAVGDRIGSGKDYLTLKLIAAGACVLVVLCSSLWYANIAAMIQSGHTPGDIVAEGSLWIFALTVIASGFAKFIAEDEED